MFVDVYPLDWMFLPWIVGEGGPTLKWHIVGAITEMLRKLTLGVHNDKLSKRHKLVG
jgi:hypothetical protein